MSVIHAPTEAKLGIRLLVLPVVLLVAFGGFFLRLWYWQVVKAEEYEEEAVRARRITDVSLAPRGKVVDRKGVVIADVRHKYVITARPAEVGRHPEVLEKVAEILQVDVKRLEQAVYNYRHRANLPTPIFVGATVQKAGMIAEMGELLPGIGVVSQPMREYRESVATSHITGWVDVPSKEIEERLKEQGVNPAEYVGRDGIESRYEVELMGEPGRAIIALDSKRRPTGNVVNESPTPGQTLVLSIDLDLQRLATELLGDRKGAVVALDPSTGEVLCMAATPNFDVRMFDGRLTQSEVDYLFRNESRPMLKRAIAGTYPPGSTFKIVTAVGAEMAGRFSPGNSVYCPGYITVGNRRVRCENHPASSMNFHMAFTKSCNSYFGKMAQSEGADAVRNGARAMGLGQKSGIDLPGEAAGKVPDDAWVKEHHKRPWSLGDTNNIGIGQGDMLVTPLQMANVAAMVANRGTIYRPRLLKATIPFGVDATPVQVPREVLFQVDLNAQFWDRMQSAMVNVVNQGTARSAQVDGVQVAGKTGSAENAKRPTHAWFVGYAPAQNPKIAFAVVIENVGHGGTYAAPLAQKIVERYLKPPTPVQPASADSSAAIVSVSQEESADD